MRQVFTFLLRSRRRSIIETNIYRFYIFRRDKPPEKVRNSRARRADEENDRIYDIRSALAKDRYYEFPDEALEKKLAKLSKGKYTNVFEFDDIGGFEVKECEFEK